MVCLNTIHHGDCLNVLSTFPDNCMDSCVTDPPYGLSKEPDIREVLEKWLAGEDYTHRGGGFMGKSWDSFVPGPAIWREVYRVLKPGGHALVFAGTRTQDLMTISLRLAGFEVRDVIEWLYFSGFPKSHDVGKAFDRRNGRNYPEDDFRDYLKERATSVGMTGADVDRALGTNGMWGHYVGRSQPAFPTADAWQRMKPLLNLDDRYDEIIHRVEAEREKVGEREKLESYQYKGNNVYQTGGDKDRVTIDITAPATELARKWDGWGTALKPAHEPIIVVRKPLIGAVVDNVEKYGTGAINIDASRIATEDDLNGVAYAKNSQKDVSTATSYGLGVTGKEFSQPEGRFPANCVTTEPDAFFSKYFNVTPPELCKKASKKDRNSDWQGAQVDAGNHHPTVKPVDLMAWLVRLVTPPNGTVLDPFAGSGSTLVAARREGFGFIGIEREAEYLEIARARVIGE